jgi:hypothetical protein
MRLECANKTTIILHVIHQKDKVQYFNNKSTMMIIKQIMESLSIGL